MGMASVTQVLVGLRRIGIVGLRESLKAVEAAGATERDEVVDVMLETLSGLNYIPSHVQGDYREALWREYKRHRGEDIRDLYSEIEIVVRGEPGADLDRFLRALRNSFGEHELKPAVTIEEPDPSGRNPQMLIDGEVVLAGTARERDVERAVRAQISDW
jgi:hypothetical protein